MDNHVILRNDINVNIHSSMETYNICIGVGSVGIKKPSFIGSCRFTLMILCNLGVFQMMILRFNLSMAIVCMTEKDPKSSINLNETDSIHESFSLNTQNDSSNISQVHIVES